MYISKYFTNEEIDERLLQGYYDDIKEKGYTGSKDEFLNILLEFLNSLRVKLFNSKSEFPEVGSEHVVYVDKATNNSYIWNNILMKYSKLDDESNSLRIYTSPILPQGQSFDIKPDSSGAIRLILPKPFKITKYGTQQDPIYGIGIEEASSVSAGLLNSEMYEALYDMIYNIK